MLIESKIEISRLLSECREVNGGVIPTDA